VAIKDPSTGQIYSLEHVVHAPHAFTAKYHLAQAPSKPLGPGSLGNLDPRVLVNAFRQFAGTSGTLSRHSFTKVFTALAKDIDTQAISALFDAFDADGNGVIDATEFVAGAVTLCGGDRDLKIRLSFDILDRDGNGVLDRSEMEAYMESVFRVVANSNPTVFAKHNISPQELARITVESAMEFADTDGNGVISFDEFRHWMLSEPTAAVASPPQKQQQQRGKGLTQLGSLDQVRAETGLGELSADEVIDAFLTEADKRGQVTLPGFKRALSAIMRKTGRQPSSLRHGLAEALFRAVDSDQSGGCDIEELGSAFSVLCAGSRDDRCMAAFEMWDEDGDGYLDVEEMSKLLTSVYKVLYASDPKVAVEMGVPPHELGAITAQAAVDEYDTDGDGRLNYNEFRAWYSKPAATSAALPRDNNDWVSLEETRRLTGLGRFNSAVVMEAFAVVADEDGMVRRKDFLETLEHLGPRGLSPADQKRARLVRERLFALYEDNGRVDFSLLASALAMLSGGMAEDKKRAVFELMDTDFSGTVERGEFLRFMQSTMRVLYESQPGTQERIGVGPDELAEIVTDDAFERFDVNKDGRLSFDEFSAYWEEEGEKLPDGSSLEATRELLGTDRFSVDDLFELVASAADHQGWISLESFIDVMSDIARRGRQLDAQQEGQLKRTLERLYAKFDTDRSGTVDLAELAAGLSVLSGGHRDERAEAAFRLFDPTGSGTITLPAMEAYLTAVFNTMIEVGGAEVRQRIGSASAAELAKATAESVFLEADLNADGTLSYSEWKRFYSQSGGQALDSVMHTAPQHISIAEVKQRTGLDRMTAAECFEHFARAADERGELSKPAFVSVFASIAPQPHDARLMLCIDRLFQVLDSNGDQRVDYVELSSGLSVLTGGSQKEKLASTFALLDVDGNGTIDLGELERYILSVYRVMYAEPGTQERMGGIPVEELARMTAEEVMVSANLTHTGELTLEEFEKWIESDGGAQLAEPAVRLAAQDKAWMTIPEMARLTNLRSLASEQLFARFKKAANARGELTRQAFASVVHAIMAVGPRLSADDALKAEMAVDRLFDALDVNHDQTVDITELSAGISILAGGSRDAKVRSAFEMYDTDGNGYISPQEMYNYLLSVYRVLFETQPQVRESMNGVSAEELAKVTTEEAFAAADANGDGQLSFEEFQAWYSVDDELGAGAKPAAGAKKHAAARSPPPPSEVERRSSRHSATHRPQGLAVYQPQPRSQSPQRTAPSLEVDLETIRALTGLGALDAKEAFGLLAAHADRASRTLTLQQFVHAIRAVAPASRSPAEDDLLLRVSKALFVALDKNGDSRVDMQELAAGVAYLCAPAESVRQSSSGLFSIFSRNGEAVRYEDFERMLESIFATMLVADPEARAIARERTPRQLAQETARVVIAQADVNRDGTVSRDEFENFILHTDSGKALSMVIRAEQALSLATLGLEGVKALTGLGKLDAADVYETVAEVCGDDGELSRLSFKRVLQSLAPRGTDQNELVLVGNALFDAIDADASGGISFDEMSAALSILCRGDPHRKSEDFFALYDLDGDGYVSFDELFFYLRSVFRLMNAITGGNPADDIDLIARATAKEVLREADVSGDGLISLDEFKAWMGLSSSVSTSQGGLGAYAGLYDTPASDMGEARQVLGLQGVAAEDLFNALASKANSRGEIDLHGFSEVLSAYATRRGDARKAGALIRALFTKLDLDGNGKLDFAEVASGMSILAGDDVVSKLKAAFAVYDVSGDGYISRDEMETYLTSVFTVVMATAPGWAEASPGVTPEQLAKATAAECFAHCDINHDGLLDFNEFSSWILGDQAGKATKRVMDSTDELTLADIRRITGLEQYHPTTVFEALAMHADAQGELSQEAFTHAFAGFAKRNMSASEASNLRVVLNRVFALFDADGNGKVSFAELASGLSVLCNGTKKDKVGAAFSAFGNGDALSQSEVETLLRSVFRVLLDTVPGAKSKVGASAHELAKATAEQMFIEAGRSHISLQEFSDFFESTGLDGM